MNIPTKMGTNADILQNYHVVAALRPAQQHLPPWPVLRKHYAGRGAAAAHAAQASDDLADGVALR